MRQVPRALVPLLLALFLIAVALPGSAATIAPPANLGELARISPSVVLAEAVGSHSELRGEIPYTLTSFRTVQAVAGQDTGRTFTLEAPGGVVGERGFRVPGTPHFAKGGRYLLFLSPAPSGNWRLKMSSYGILREVAGTGLLQPVAEAAELDVLPRPGVEAIGTYREKDLLPQLTAAHGGVPWHRAASEATSEDLAKVAGAAVTTKAGNLPGVYVSGAPSACRYVAADPNPPTGTPDLTPLRWFGFETGTTVSYWSTTPGQTGILDGGASAVQNGVAAWANHNASVVNLVYAGSKASSFNCATNGGYVSGEVTFNDPCNVLSPLDTSCTAAPEWTSAACCGYVAMYGYSYNASQTLNHDGNNWHPITGVGVLVNDGSQCLGETDFQEMMTHFLGHAVGFEHHNDMDATMYGSLGVHPPRGAAISTTDKACASFDYHTFLDIPYSYFAWRFIEGVNNAGVMTTCGSGNFCPNDVVTRGSMALLLLRAKEGAGYVPPPCTTATFNDVPCSDPLAPWVEELVRRGVTAGCGGGNYCPANAVTRNQMAVFLIKTVEGPSFVPPACTTDPFNDVPCSSPFAPWVKLITDRGITAGCGGGSYCPNNEVNRAQMAVFSSVSFHFPLP
ncbi:MAG TPA: S-layer homology domain-containing protein [Thermoanaerobaculia bacterium]|nr:S-layer homology domain-containing protein [Thermoanaerobaculia bacterium]